MVRGQPGVDVRDSDYRPVDLGGRHAPRGRMACARSEQGRDQEEPRDGDPGENPERTSASRPADRRSLLCGHFPDRTIMETSPVACAVPPALLSKRSTIAPGATGVPPRLSGSMNQLREMWSVPGRFEHSKL